MATLSLMGLYNYDNSILEDLKADNLPANIDASTLKDKLIIDTAELEIVLPNPDVFKYVFRNWLLTHKTIWQKLAATMDLEYNPIWNKDGTFEETRERTLKEDETTKGTGKTTNTHNDATNQSLNGTTENKKSAYNGNDYADYDKTTVTNSATDTTNGGYTDNTETNTDRDRGETETETYTRREYGNIGLTSTQQLIKEERDIVQFSLYDYIVAEFKSRFCIMVY